MELLSEADAEALVAAPSPRAFWRKRRGVTQSALAGAAGISQSDLADLERGRRRGDPALFARALGVRMEDLVDG